MRGAVPPPQYVFMAWCVVKHGDNFTFFIGRSCEHGNELSDSVKGGGISWPAKWLSHSEGGLCPMELVVVTVTRDSLLLLPKSEPVLRVW
jgi:hypothetical protein